MKVLKLSKKKLQQKAKF